MSRQNMGPPYGGTGSASVSNPRLNAPTRTESRDSGFVATNPSGSAASAMNQNRPVVSDFDFDWGDDDDDMDMVMASQAVEAAVEQQQQQQQYQQPQQRQQPTNIGRTRRIESSPSSRDPSMTLEMIRFGLALKESNGEDVRMEDFMRDGVLGGDISASQSATQKDKERIAELERINKELKSENYSCKGEVTNLRRLLQKQSQERNKELLNRQAREEENRRKEAENRKKNNDELTVARTELMYAKKELRCATEKNEAYKKQLARLQALASQASPGPSAAGSSANTSHSILDSSRALPSTSLASMGFPSMSAFQSREVGVPTAPILSFNIPAAKEVIETAEKEVQSDPKMTESPEEIALAKWREDHAIQMELLATCIEGISVTASKELKFALPAMKKIADRAENELVRGLNLQGFRYELFFPGNLKLAEFKMDEAKRKGKENVPPPSVKISFFPSRLPDWPGTFGFDGTVHRLLFAQQDVWGAMGFVLRDLMRRITHMRLGRRNSVYRVNNSVHFMKLLTWSASLWNHFQEPLWYVFVGKSAKIKQDIMTDIRQWSACMLWVGNQYFKVLDFQVQVRPLVLRTLESMARSDVFHCTYANYLRVYYLIYHTLTIDRHTNLDNLLYCLGLAHEMRRKKFCFDFICRGKDDGTCLAYIFAVKSMEAFDKEKDPERKYRVYHSYVGLLVSLDWCAVHMNGECGEDVQEEDADDFMTNPVFVVPERRGERTDEPISSSSEEVIPGPSKQRLFNLTINSFYGSEDISINSSHDTESDYSSSQAANSEPSLPKKQKVGDDEMQPTSSTRAVHGSGSFPFVVSDQSRDAGNNAKHGAVDDSDENSEASEDEWDEIQREAMDICDKSAPRESAPADAPCRKFLDCSLWEEHKTGPKIGHCQCRFHLLETFMRMTEEVIHIWRHYKVLAEFRELDEAADKFEERELELEELVRSLEESNRKKGSRSGTSFEEDQELSKDNPFWKRILMDVKRVRPEVTPDEVASTLSYAVEIVYDAYLTTQYNTRTAFGSEGTNSFHAIIALLLQFSKALHFTDDMKTLIYNIAVEVLPGKGGDCSSTQPGSQRNNAGSFEGIPSGYESFDAPVQLQESPQLDLSNPQIRTLLPSSLIKSIEEFEARKKAARDAQHFDDKDPEAMEVDPLSPSQCNQKRQQRFSMNTSSDLFASSQMNNIPIGDGAAPAGDTDSEDSCESDSESDDASGDSGWETVDSDVDEEADIKKDVKTKVVEDYDEFCGPVLEEQPDFFEIEQEHFEVTYEQLVATLKKGPKQECKNLIKFKSAKEACEELSKAGGDARLNEPYPGPEVEFPEQLETVVQTAMSRLSFKDYYKDKTEIWNDYKDRSLPVKI